MIDEKDIKPGSEFMGLVDGSIFKIKEIKPDTQNKTQNIIIEYRDTKTGKTKTSETNKEHFKRLLIIKL